MRVEIADRIAGHPRIQQQAIARRAGVRPQRLSDYLHGRATLGSKAILRLLEVLGGEVGAGPLITWSRRVRA